MLVVGEFLLELDSLDNIGLGLLFDQNEFSDVRLGISDKYSLVSDPVCVELFQPFSKLDMIG